MQIRQVVHLIDANFSIVCLLEETCDSTGTLKWCIHMVLVQPLFDEQVPHITHVQVINPCNTPSFVAKFFDILLNATNYLPILLPSNTPSINIFAYLKYFMEFC